MQATALRARLDAARASDTATAAGLAAATMAQQIVAVAITIVFTRLLGTAGYGSLAALLNLTVILLVPGAALQVAAAREGTLGRLGQGAELAATLGRWMRILLAGLALVALASVAGRVQLAALLNIDEVWAAAAVPVTGAMWLLLSIQRGLLQAARAYRPVALSIVLESLGRLVAGIVLVEAGLGVTGAYLGTFAAFTCAAIALWFVLRHRLGAADPATPRHPLRALARTSAIPIGGLVCVAALQNVDVIMAKRVFAADPAGVYAAATVAGKAIVWVAVGVGLWVLPEATRRAAQGLDPRRILGRALGVIAVLAAPALILFATVPGLLLRIVFGPDYESGEVVLLRLGCAYALLACTYLCVQFLLGLHRRRFVLLLIVAAVAEPLLLAGAASLESFASRVLAVQAVTAVALLALAARTRPKVKNSTAPSPPVH